VKAEEDEEQKQGQQEQEEAAEARTRGRERLRLRQTHYITYLECTNITTPVEGRIIYIRFTQLIAKPDNPAVDAHPPLPIGLPSCLMDIAIHQYFNQ
jgi:hypothetical protein